MDVNKIYSSCKYHFFEQIKYLYKNNHKVEVFAVNVPIVNNADEDVYKFAIKRCSHFEGGV